MQKGSSPASPKAGLPVADVPFVIWLVAQVNRADSVGQLARRSLASNPSDPETREALHEAMAEWGSSPRR